MRLHQGHHKYIICFNITIRTKLNVTILQQNAEWMCAVAIVIFTAAQCLISYAQYKQELRFKRFNLAQQMDEACIIYKFDKESVQKSLTGSIKINLSLCIF